MALPIDLPEPSSDESSEITSARETDTNCGEEGDEFWVRYPCLKSIVDTAIARGFVSKDYAYERAKLFGDEKAKELNEEWFLMELEFCRLKCEFLASLISKMLSAK